MNKIINTSIKGEELLENLLSEWVENEWIEYKHNFHGVDELWKGISALSNTACVEEKDFWYIIFWIEDKTLNILWTTFSPKTHKVKKDDLIHWISQRLEPKINFKIFNFQYKGKKIIIFEISSAVDKPINYQKQSYIRIATITRGLKDFPEKEEKIWKNYNNRSFEKEIAKMYIIPDDVIKLLDYPAFFELTNQNLPSNKFGILDKLEQENFIRKNNSRFDITNLWALLFAKNLHNFEWLKRKSIRIVIYKWKDKIDTIKENENWKWYAIWFEEIIKYIDEQLITNEEIWIAFRKENKIYPQIAIRELVANMIIHQDFFEKWTNPMIEIFQDRIEITNPWKPLIKTERFMDHSPKSRNEDLASFMRRIKICEERGSWIDKVFTHIELLQLPAPKIENKENYTKITLFKYEKLSKMGKNKKIQSCYWHSVLKYIQNEKMTNSSLRQRFQIKDKHYIASRIIKDTLEAWKIKPYNDWSKSTRDRKYIPIWA